MMGIRETVISGFRRNDLKCLEDIYGTLLKGIQPLRVASTADLLDAINNTNSSLARNFGAENFIPRNVFEGRIDGTRKCCTAIR